MDKYDIFEFKIGKRPSGKEVIEIHIKLPPIDGRKRTYFLGFLTKQNMEDLIKVYKYGEL